MGDRTEIHILAFHIQLAAHHDYYGRAIVYRL